jgi:hypothetical protein
MLTGVLTPQERLAGFGDPVVILIAAVGSSASDWSPPGSHTTSARP